MFQALESFYSIDQWGLIDGRLVVRFLPDFYAADFVDPVLEVMIEEPTDIAAVEVTLATLRTETIVDVQVTDAGLELWSEYDDQARSIRARKVNIARLPYSREDLVGILGGMEKQLASAYAESRDLRGHLKDIEAFVVNLLTRAQSRQAMSSRMTVAASAQIDVLSRVLNHVREV